MARKQLGLLCIGLVCLLAPALPARGGDKGLKKEIYELNQITGGDVREAAVKWLIDDKEKAKEILKSALPAAQKKELSYDAAFALGEVAAKMKDMKTAEIYLRVCGDKAAKLQSLRKLQESYGTLIDFYYDSKQYGDTVPPL